MQMKEEILKIYVQIEDTISVNGKNSNINMIRFTGYARSSYFNGKILPGGVDLQSCKKGTSNYLSARYIMEGVDLKGQECRIYIENNGCENENNKVITKPRVVTDSQELQWLEEENLEGTIFTEDNMLVIIIGIV